MFEWLLYLEMPLVLCGLTTQVLLRRQGWFFKVLLLSTLLLKSYELNALALF
jgi:hypothetical protein